jgi:NADH:ubiquinone oxidoreductase subunit
MMKLTIKFRSHFLGKYIGKDEWGNRYFESKFRDRFFGRKSRWVVYNGTVEASKVSGPWFNWLHHQANEIPTLIAKVNWDEVHRVNPTGTFMAYHPNSLSTNEGKRAKVLGDYETWIPNSNNDSISEEI